MAPPRSKNQNPRNSSVTNELKKLLSFISVFIVFRPSNSSFDNFSQLLHSSQNKRIFENILGVLSRIWNRIFWRFFEHKIPGSTHKTRLKQKNNFENLKLKWWYYQNHKKVNSEGSTN